MGNSRSDFLVTAVALLSLAAGHAAAATPVAPAPAQCQLGRAVPVDATDRTIAFPLKTHPGARFLDDAAGNPFFMHGDTAWSLIAQLPRDAVEEYLQDRRRRGFNTLLVSLLEHRFATGAPNNTYGEPPFLTPGDYATPNEKYFAHADWVLGRAQELGFVVLLTPSYVGNQGGDEGWYQEMLKSGPQKLHDYGRYLGKRYQNLKNIVWLHGGDYDPPNKDVVRAIVDGIREIQPTALHSAHGSPGRAALEYWRGEPWLDLNNVYTYEPVIHAARKQYADAAAMPFFLIESAYEDEHDAGEWRLRLQTYQAVLSGATGQIFGNNPIWHFDGPGIYDAPATWRQALNSRGAQSMTVFCNLYASVDWWRLKPDLSNELVIDGRGSDREGRAVAALADDRSFALVYLPSTRVVTLDLSRLAGPMVAATWYDPSSGRSHPVGSSPFRNTASHPLAFAPAPPRNDAGLNDWVLELRSQPETIARP
jgi:hypothetical protein